MIGSHASPLGLKRRGAMGVSFPAAAFSRYSRSISSRSATGGSWSGGNAGRDRRIARRLSSIAVSEAQIAAARRGPMPTTVASRPSAQASSSASSVSMCRVSWISRVRSGLMPGTT
jgi:hypothetical protein